MVTVILGGGAILVAVLIFLLQEMKNHRHHQEAEIPGCIAQLIAFSESNAPPPPLPPPIDPNLDLKKNLVRSEEYWTALRFKWSKINGLTVK